MTRIRRGVLGRALPIGVIVAAALATGRAAGQAADAPSTIVQKVAFDQNLGATVPANLEFRDEAGRSVRLGDYFGKRPLILTLVYYRCPMLCTQELNSLTRSLRAVNANVGEAFDVLTVSISPTETPALAREKKASYLKSYGRPGAGAGWHFLTGPQGSIAGLADVAGFRYAFNERTGLYAHAAGLVVLSPEGKITKYFSGIDYPSKDIRLAVSEAGRGRVSSPIGRMILLCYDYDPATGRYTLAIMRVIQVLGVLTVLILGGSVFLMSRRDRRRSAAAVEGPAPNPL